MHEATGSSVEKSPQVRLIVASTFGPPPYITCVNVPFSVGSASSGTSESRGDVFGPADRRIVGLAPGAPGTGHEVIELADVAPDVVPLRHVDVMAHVAVARQIPRCR